MVDSEPALGVLMLNTRFPRPPGDIGNPESFTVPVHFERVERARVANVVVGGALDEELLADFAAAARRLEARGATFVTTGCGFLAPAQDTVAGAVSVPVAVSALMLLAPLRRLHPGATLGVLTFDATALSQHHLAPWDSGPLVAQDIAAGGELHRVIREDQETLNPQAAEADCVQAAQRLKSRAGTLAAVVLECTNLPPYRAAIAAALECPVYDIHTLIQWRCGARPSDESSFSSLPSAVT